MLAWAVYHSILQPGNYRFISKFPSFTFSIVGIIFARYYFPTTSTLELLKAENITKQFGAHLALSDVCISVPENSIYGLLGPNGAGKTTLIRIITQIIAADHGKLYLRGKPLQQDQVREIGYLPEERGLYKKMKVGEHLLYLARLRGLRDSEARQSIRYWLDRFDISSWSNKKIEDLSKGMQQKIQFIATILHKPRIVILDEPFSGFDPINVNLLKEEILSMKEAGTSIIFSTHRMESVEELCDHIALINKSKKILEGPKHEIKDAFKNQTYVVEHRGKFDALEDRFELLDRNNGDGDLFESTIRVREQHSPNELLAHLIQVTEVCGFREKIPSMNEIFIMKVQGGPDHA
jgi:ABC-2 type transport system ATP-binding protein